jgi:hypothetical protein
VETSLVMSEFLVLSCVISTLSETFHSKCQALLSPDKLDKVQYFKLTVLALIKLDRERRNLYHRAGMMFRRIWLLQVRSRNVSLV